MKRLGLFSLLALIIIAASAGFGQSRIGGRVIEVIDGRTVRVEMPNRSRIIVQLQYIEVPEGEQPFCKIAKEHLSTLVLDQKIEIRARGLSNAKTVGQIFLKGVDVSQQMIRDGAAWYAVLEKTGQDAAESQIYQSNEASAKTEKLGIWSIENLKPSWQIRAEAEEKRRREERLTIEEYQKLYDQTPTRQTAPRQLNNSNFGIWGDVKSYTNGQATGAGGLEIKYDSNVRAGYVATTQAIQNLAVKNSNQTVDLRMAYVYRDIEQGRNSIYLIGIFSEADDWKFLKSNNLTVTADGQKIVLGKAYRLYRQTPTSAQELLLYKINRAAIAKIVKAKNLQVNLGVYSGKLSDKLQGMLKNLLDVAA